MIVDAHTHLAQDLGTKEMIEVMDDGGVDRAVLIAEAVESFAPDVDATLGLPVKLLTSPLSPLGCLRYRGMVQDGRLRAGRSWLPISPKPDNEPVAAAVRAHPDRFIGLAFVNPADPDHLQVVQRYLDAGFRGLKVNAWFHGIRLYPQLLPAAKLCGSAGYPIMIHLGGTKRTGLSVLELANRLPTTNFILAHAGLPFYAALWRAARIHPNLYFDLSGPYMSAELVGLTAANVPPGRLLFASGAPHGLRLPGGGYSYALVRSWVEALPISRKARAAILGGNIARLVGLRAEANTA